MSEVGGRLIEGSACVASIVRLYYTVLLYRSHDVSYHIGLMGIWTEPELTCGFVAASAPVIPRFVKYLKHKTPFRQVIRRFGKRDDPNEAEIVEVRDEKGQARKVISDVDFHELVVKTDGTATTMGSEESDALKKQERGSLVIERQV